MTTRDDILADIPATAGIELDTIAFADHMSFHEKKWKEMTYEEQQKTVWEYIQKENGFTPEEIVL